MLRRLFARLTADARRGEPLFAAVIEAARAPHWYVEGEVPDTIDGRFAMLATLTALVIVRLETLGEEGREASVALTERFVEAMNEEHRQLGLGDPTLGKQVLSLVGSLAGRVELWRGAVGEPSRWTEAVERSVYRGASPSASALQAASNALETFWTALARLSATRLYQGRLQ